MTDDKNNNDGFQFEGFGTKLKIDPETALKGTNRKFIARFKELERTFGDTGRELRDVSLEEMEEVWQSNKGKVSGP